MDFMLGTAISCSAVRKMDTLLIERTAVKLQETILKLFTN